MRNMRKRHVSLLLVLAAIAMVLVAGCTAPTQKASPIPSPVARTSTSLAKTSTTTAVSSPSPSPSLSPTPAPIATATPTGTPTPVSIPPATGKIATTVEGDKFFLTQGDIAKGTPVHWGFEVTAQSSQPPIICGNGATVTVTIDGHAAGEVTPFNPGSTKSCFETASFDLSAKDTAGLSTGKHTFKISYAGDSTYQPSYLVAVFNVT